MKTALIVAVALVTASCSSWQPVNYNYSHETFAGDSCKIAISSSRNVKAASLAIDKECQLVVEAKEVQESKTIVEAIEVLTTKIGKVP